MRDRRGGVAMREEARRRGDDEAGGGRGGWHRSVLVPTNNNGAGWWRDGPMEMRIRERNVFFGVLVLMYEEGDGCEGQAVFTSVDPRPPAPTL